MTVCPRHKFLRNTKKLTFLLKSLQLFTKARRRGKVRGDNKHKEPGMPSMVRQEMQRTRRNVSTSHYATQQWDRNHALLARHEVLLPTAPGVRLDKKKSQKSYFLLYWEAFQRICRTVVQRESAWSLEMFVTVICVGGNFDVSVTVICVSVNFDVIVKRSM